MTVGRVRRARSTPARVGARALAARREARRPASIQAIEPPPAPTVWMSTVGSRTGSPPTARSAARSAAPPSIRQTSVDVPPMSKESASPKPAARATRAAPTTPPAGPETSTTTGCAAASRASRRPPDERITSGSGRPAAGTPSPAAEVARDDRPEVGVDRGRRRPLVLAELGRDLVRGDDARVRQPPPQLVGDRPLVRRVAEREEEADRDRLRVQRPAASEVERLDDAVRPDPLAHPDAALERHERRRVRRAEPVQVRRSWRRRWSSARSPPWRRTPCARPSARAARSSHGRAVREALDRASRRPPARPRATDSSCRAGRHLRRPQPSAGDEHSVRERPADVDAEDRHTPTLRSPDYGNLPRR